MNNRIYPRISTSVSKLGENIATVNLPPKITCNANAPCVAGGCYACKGRFCFKRVKESLQNNLNAYAENPQRYFDVIDSTLRMIPYKFFRFHSSGDIVDDQYLKLMFQLARKHRNTKFLCFTKKFNLVNTAMKTMRKPSNLILVFSNWGDFICDNPNRLPTSWVRLNSGEYIPERSNECTGFCGECVNTDASCWKLKRGQAVVFNKH